MSADEIRETGAAAMTDDEIDALLEAEGVGVLGLQDEAAPYVIPMSFGFDGGDRLYFTFLLFGVHSRKVELADRANEASFLVFTADSIHDWRSVRLVGEVSPVPEAEWERLQAAMENAWHPDLFSTAAPMRGVDGYEFRVTDRFGIKHAST